MSSKIRTRVCSTWEQPRGKPLRKVTPHRDLDATVIINWVIVRREGINRLKVEFYDGIIVDCKIL